MGLFSGGIGDFFGSLGLPGGTDPEKIYGRKPEVGEISDAALKAQKDFDTIYPGATAEADKINTFNQQQLEKMLSFVAPSWKENLNLGGAQIGKMLSGELTDSDAAARQRLSVAGAFNSGTQDSLGTVGGSGRNLVARDLGLAQQDLVNKGLSSFDSWMRTVETATAPRFDVTTMFPTWKDEFSRDWQKELIAAAPDPVSRGVSDEWNALIGEVLSIYGGGAGYKNTYTPNYGGGGMGAGIGWGGNSMGGQAAANAGGYGPYLYNQGGGGSDVNIYNNGGGGGGVGNNFDIPNDWQNLGGYV